MKTLLKISLLAIVSLALLAPAIAQDTPGLTITWTTALAATNPNGGDGIAQLITYTPGLRPSPSARPKGYTKFIVQCEYVSLPSLTPIDVYVGPPTSPKEPYGKFVGRMQIVNGNGSLLITSPRAPFVTKGTTVWVMAHDTMIMKGQF